jgi:hypothetical protein
VINEPEFPPPFATHRQRSKASLLCTDTSGREKKCCLQKQRPGGKSLEPQTVFSCSSAFFRDVMQNKGQYERTVPECVALRLRSWKMQSLCAWNQEDTKISRKHMTYLCWTWGELHGSLRVLEFGVTDQPQWLKAVSLRTTGIFDPRAAKSPNCPSHQI